MSNPTDAKLIETATQVMREHFDKIEHLVEVEGMTVSDALKAVLLWRQGMLKEIAEGKTERAKEIRQRICDSVWDHFNPNSN